MASVDNMSEITVVSLRIRHSFQLIQTTHVKGLNPSIAKLSCRMTFGSQNTTHMQYKIYHHTTGWFLQKYSNIFILSFPSDYRQNPNSIDLSPEYRERRASHHTALFAVWLPTPRMNVLWYRFTVLWSYWGGYTHPMSLTVYMDWTWASGVIFIPDSMSNNK